MSDLWLYTPEICDGDYCPMDCDKCYKAGEAMEAQAEDKRMAEKEYIEREAFRREIDEHRPGRSYEDAWALTILDFIPSADVRPVVLCRECLHYEMGACLKIYDDGAANKDAWQERKPDDFCSYGEDRNVPTNCGADMREER